MRAAALVATALALWGVGGGARAQELTVAGRVVDGHGDPAPGVEIRLLGSPPPFEQGLLELAGRALPRAHETLETDDAGRFAVTVPEAGFWQLTAEAPGSTPARYDFGLAPLLDSTLLPTLELQPAQRAKVAVYTHDGEAAAGAWVESELAEPPPRRMRELTWQAFLPRVCASETGEATLVIPAGATVRVRAWRVDHQASDPKIVEDAAIRLDLIRAPARHLTVRDADDRPVAGAVLRVGDLAWPAGRTDEDGNAVIHDREALLVLADGRLAGVSMAEEEGMPKAPLEVRIPDASPLAGRVLDSETRRGVAGAFVAPLRSVAGHVRTDARGSFTLDSSSRDRSSWITVAARGYLESTTHLERARSELALTLEPAVELRGVVVDFAGDPVADVEVVAAPHGNHMRRLSRVFSLPVRRSVSDSQGEFVVPRLPLKHAYAVTARGAGLAPAEVIVSDPEAAADSGGIVLRLVGGTQVTAKIVSPSGLAVPGAAATLERQAENTALRYLYAGRTGANAFLFHSRSDGEGELSFANVPVGRFRVEIEAPGFATESVPAFEIEPGMRTHDLGVLELEAGVALAGRVVDPEGTSLAGAEVTASASQHSWNAVPSPPVSTTTGADGSFTVEDRREGEFLGLEVALAGYARQSLERVEVPRPTDFVIVLQPAVTLRGRVVDAGGAAIAQAQVDVLHEGGGGTFAGRVFTRPIASDQSDESGWFEVEGIEPATVRVRAGADGWLPRELGGIELVAGEELDELEIELEPGSAIEGRVVAPDGAPQTGAAVRLEGLVSFSRSSMATTDGDGRYRLGGLEPGHHVVVASTEDGLQSSLEIEVEPGDNALDFYLEGGVTVSGSVVDSSSEPIEDAAVTLRSPGSGYRSSRLAQSDAAGAFVIENVNPGVFHVSAEHPDHASAELEQPLEVRDLPVAGLLLRLDDGARLTGALVGAAPKDLVSMQVIAIRQPLAYKEGRVESDGTYAIGNLAPGIWTVTASSATGLQAQEPIEIGPGEQLVTLDLDFGGGLALTGRIVRRGEPLSGASVWVSGVESAERAWGESDYEGRFRLDGLEPGRYTLQISDFSSGTSHAEEIEMQRDQEVLIELEGGTVSGRVTAERGGAPLAGASVVLEPRAASGARRQAKGVTSDDSGNFRLEEISPGEYDLRASKAGHAAQTRPLRIDGDAEISGVELALSRVEGLTLALRLPGGGAPPTLSYAVLDLQDQVFLSGSAPVTGEGRARLTTIPDGSWKLLLQASGAAIRTLRAQAPQEELVVDLQPAAQLQVRVEELTRDSSAVATLRIVASDGTPFKSLAWHGLEDRWRLHSGHASVGALPPGRWILEITTTDNRNWQRSVTLAAGVNETVVFD